MYIGVESSGKKDTGVVGFLGCEKIVELQLRNDQSIFFNFSGSSITGFAKRSITAQKLMRKPLEEATKGEGCCFSASILKNKHYNKNEK